MQSYERTWFADGYVEFYRENTDGSSEVQRYYGIYADLVGIEPDPDAWQPLTIHDGPVLVEGVDYPHGTE